EGGTGVARRGKCPQYFATRETRSSPHGASSFVLEGSGMVPSLVCQPCRVRGLLGALALACLLGTLLRTGGFLLLERVLLRCGSLTCLTDLCPCSSSCGAVGMPTIFRVSKGRDMFRGIDPVYRHAFNCGAERGTI